MLITLLALWLALPMIAARATRRSDLPRVALLILLLGLVLIIAGAILRADPTLIATKTLAPEVFPNGAVMPDFVLLGLIYIGLSGVGFIIYGLGTGAQRNGFGLGFWLAHIGLGAILAQAFGDLLPAANAETSASQMVMINQAAALAMLIGLLLMLLFFAHALIKGRLRH